MASCIRIRNWDKWQTYRRDRGKPPWIKVYKRLLLDPTWSQLTDAQRGHLVTMWLLAGDRDGVTPTPHGWQGDLAEASKMIAKLGFLDGHPDLQLFAELGFVEIDASVTPSRRQDGNQTGPVMSAQCSTGQGSTGERGNARAPEPDDPATPRSGTDHGLPPEAANLSTSQPATTKQMDHIRTLCESQSVDPIKALAETGYQTWTMRSAGLVINTLRRREAEQRQHPRNGDPPRPTKYLSDSQIDELLDRPPMEGWDDDEN